MIREVPMSREELQRAIDDMVAARCTERSLLKAARSTFFNLIYTRHPDRSQQTYLFAAEVDGAINPFATLTRIDGAWWVYPYHSPDERAFCEDWTDSSGYPCDSPADLVRQLPRFARERGVELEAL